jgi:DNA-binding IscR family transcriptional regulator
LAAVRGLRPEAVNYNDDAQNLKGVWLALRVALRQVFETLTLQDVISGEYSAEVRALLENPDANISRPIFATD